MTGSELIPEGVVRLRLKLVGTEKQGVRVQMYVRDGRRLITAVGEGWTPDEALAAAKVVIDMKRKMGAGIDG